jgi:predicted outer membrane repeat protein
MGGAIEKQNGSPTLIDCDFSGNSAERHGGAIRMTGGTATITGGTVSGNTAVRHDGGGIEIGNCATTVDGVTITGNHAVCTNPNGAGGGLCIEGCTVTVKNCTIQNNECWDDEGGIRAKNGATLDRLSYTNTISNNWSRQPNPDVIDNISIENQSQEQ